VVVGYLNNIGVGETIQNCGTATAGCGSLTVAGVTTLVANADIIVPAGTVVAVGETVTGTGIPAAAVVNAVNGQIVTLSAPATATGNVSVTFSQAGFFPAGTSVVSTQTVNTGTGPQNQVTLSAANTAPAAGLPTGRTLTFSSAALFPAGTTITNICVSGAAACPNSNIITLSANATATASNIPVTFNVAAGISSTTCPMIPFGLYGGASTDPNNGSLWLYGEFAKNRLSTIPGPGQWGTSVANYALDFPATDPYNNANNFYADVPATNPFFTWIQISKNQGITQNAPTSGPCPTNPAGNPPIQQPPASGGTPNPGPSALVCPNFGPTTLVTRSEMARWVVLAQMDEFQITAYLLATGGDVADPHHVTFADTINDPNLRYIEVMARRGYTKGCGTTNDGRAAYCPTNNVTRGEMSVFIIRAKMSNVFPTSLSGAPIPVIAPYGDNFGVFQQAPYFTDVPTTHTFYPYIQKMRELRITNGAGSAATYLPDNNITRQEIATFIVRAFFL